MKTGVTYQKAEANKPHTLYIVGEIGGFDMPEKSLYDALAQIPTDAPLEVRINSLGGAVDVALGWYNAIARRNATTINWGIAASAAATVMLSGRRRQVCRGATWMLHNCWTSVSGDKAALEKTIEMLDTIMDGTFKLFEAVTKLPRETLVELFSRESWISDEESLKLNLATEIIEPPNVSPAANAKMLLRGCASTYKSLPAHLIPTDPPRLPDQLIVGGKPASSYTGSSARAILARLVAEREAKRRGHPAPPPQHPSADGLEGPSRLAWEALYGRK